MGAFDAYFAARFVPAKYAALGLAVAAFARGQYAAAFRPKAIEKVKTLSDGEVRERLLRLVEENPDVGLKILA